MAQLLIDLDSQEDLKLARRLIEERLDASAAYPPEGTETADSDREAPDDSRAEELVRRLWSRITEQRTRDLLVAFASFDQPFSLREVAERTDGRTYDEVKAQKFRLGRSEKRLLNELGLPLLTKEWNGRENEYAMSESVRTAIRRQAT
jgi:hypothetical protein